MLMPRKITRVSLQSSRMPLVRVEARLFFFADKRRDVLCTDLRSIQPWRSTD